jgi:hypothetical protein
MNAPCTLDLGYEPIELPSYARQREKPVVSAVAAVRLATDFLVPPRIELVNQPRPRRLTREERDALEAALSASVRVRLVLRRA